MPELHNIQTYVKLNHTFAFSSVIEIFETLLQGIGISDPDLYESIKGFEWSVEDNGFVYPPQPNYYKTKFSDVRIRPLLTGVTKDVNNSLAGDWLSIELLMDTENIWDAEAQKYYPEIFSFVKSLSIEMHKLFKYTGVYFTDELQDGNDFKGITTANKDLLWQFDYGLIPSHLNDAYIAHPHTHNIVNNQHHFEAQRNDRW